MACPYFHPADRMPESDWHMHPRLPLGDPYEGSCRADRAGEWTPDGDTLRQFCNLGYGRGKCPRFPAGPGPDAHRFCVIADQAGTLGIFYAAERDHRTIASGTFDYPAGGAAPPALGSEAFRSQARAYVESYLRRQREPDERASHPNRR